MTLFGFNIFNRRETITGSGTPKGKKVVSGGYRENVVQVNNPNAAMTLSAVFRAVELTSNGVAVMPIQVKRWNNQRGIFVHYSSQNPYEREGAMLDYLLNVKPNEFMSAYELRKYTIVQMRLMGAALWVPDYDAARNLRAIYLIQPGRWVYDQINNTFQVFDPIADIFDTYSADEVMYFKNTGIDGTIGISTIAYARQTLNTVATADRETQKRFATGGRFKAFVTNDTSVKGFGEYEDSEMKKLAEQMNEEVQSGNDLMFFPGDGKIVPMSMSSADLEFLNSRVFGIREVARFFQVPLSKLMEPSNSNYKSVEMEQIDFYAETLQPLCTMIETEILSKMTDFETFRTRKIKFDKSVLFAMDLTSMSAWTKNRLETGIASVNDLRKEMDMPPVEHGDEILMSCNVAPLGSEKLGGTTNTTEPSVGGNNQNE